MTAADDGTVRADGEQTVLPVDTASMRRAVELWHAHDITTADFLRSAESTMQVAADYIDWLEEALHDARRAEARWEGRYAEATRERRRRERAASNASEVEV